jgi:hypothetical protein
VAIDLAAEFIAALRSSPAREAIAEAVRGVVASEVRAALDATRDKPRPLDEILSELEGRTITPEVARGRERRDPLLRALSVDQKGRRRRYLRHQVERHLRAKAGQ